MAAQGDRRPEGRRAEDGSAATAARRAARGRGDRRRRFGGLGLTDARGDAHAVRRLIVRTDGAARGNPGPAAAGAVLEDPDAPRGGRVVATVSAALGVTTNNVAEYIGLLLALEEAERLGARELELRLDSQLIVEQLLGRYRVRHPGLMPLHREVRERLSRFERWTVRHVPRAENAAADALANRALDQGRSVSARVRRWLPRGLFEEE